MDNTTLIALLEKNERSQRWLALKLGVSPMLICLYCKGERRSNSKRAEQILVWLGA